MKFLSLILLFILVSCGHHNRQGQFLSKSADDSLSRESLSRYDKARLEQLKPQPIMMAYQKCYRGDIHGGLKDLQIQLESNRENPSYWNKVGSCYFLNKELNKSLIYFQYAQNKSKGQLASVMNNIAMVYMYKGMDDDAKTALEEVRNRFPSFSTARFNLAHLYLKFGLLDKAINEFRVLYKKSNTDPEVLSGLAVSYYLKGSKKIALTYFKRIPESYYSRQDIGSFYSLLLKDMGNIEQARSIASKVNEDIDYMQSFTGQMKQLVLQD